MRKNSGKVGGEIDTKSKRPDIQLRFDWYFEILHLSKASEKQLKHGMSNQHLPIDC